MATVIAQNYKALFPQWFFMKTDILKLINKNHAEERLKALERTLILKQRKR